MENKNHTLYFTGNENKEQMAKNILVDVYSALEEKGYNPVNQLVGYLLSGDPAYITSHNDARNIIKKLERDEILEVLVENYLDKNN